MTDPHDGMIQAAGQGDEHAWRQLIEAYEGRVYGLVLRHCRDAGLAAEIAQATFVKVFGKLTDYQDRGRFEAWLFRIALNQLRDEMRRRKRQAVVVDFNAMPPAAFGHRSDEPEPFRALEQKEEHERLRELVSRLPEADQELLHLRFTAQLSFAQIAETLEQPLGTVLARGHRALKKLKQMIEGQDDPI